jgi:tripartite-type tricarboxylate transporter receptor subunit TctC
MKRRSFNLALSIPLLGAGSLPVRAQAQWPTKPVRVIVAGGPGSGTDLVARVFCEALSKSFGQPFVVDNKAGANGLIGTDAMVKAPNDGHVLLFTYAGAHVVNPVLLDKIPYDVNKDFAAVAQIGSGGNLLVVPPNFPAKDLKEFIAYAKARPANEMSYGSWGVGSGGHLSMEALNQAAGLKIKHIPFKSAAESNTALMAGHIQAGFSAVAAALPQINGGKLKAVAVSGPTRVKQLPDVRTMTEQGVTFDVAAWYALMAPAGTPPAVVNALNREVNRLIAAPEMASRWDQLGFQEMPIKTPAQFEEQIKRDLRDWGAVVKAGNIKAE